MPTAARALLLLSFTALLACSQASSNRWPPEGSGHLSVIAMEPAEGSTVDASTVMDVTLSYSLPVGYPGRYIVAPQFATRSHGITVSGELEGGFPPTLDSPEGAVRIRQSLESLVEDRNVAKPLEFWFYLNVVTAGNNSAIVARTGPYRFDVR